MGIIKNNRIGRLSNPGKMDIPDDFRMYEIRNVSKQIGTYATGFNSSATNNGRFITLKPDHPIGTGDIQVVIYGGFWKHSSTAWSTTVSDFRLNYDSFFNGTYWNKEIDISKESPAFQEGCEFVEHISWGQHSAFMLEGDTMSSGTHRTFFSPDRTYTTGAPTSRNTCVAKNTGRKMKLLINWNLVRSTNLGGQDFTRLA